MNYREQLQKAKEIGINPISLQVANEAEYWFSGIELSENDFELICELIEDSWLKSEYSHINNLTRALYNIICECDLTEVSIEDIVKNTSLVELIIMGEDYE